MKKTVIFILLVVVFVSFVVPTIADRVGFILCNPQTPVWARVSPNKNALICGILDCGSPITLDGKTKGNWLHVVDSCFDGDAWIYGGYVVGINVTPETCKAITTAKVRTRNMVNGKLTGTLKKGTEVIVYAYSEECCYTNKGYIKSKFLEKVEE